MVKVFIEAEIGSYEKHMYDEKTMEYKGIRQVSQPYPYPYGFILGTTTSDGDGVDCYVITKNRLSLGTIVKCNPIGLLEQFEDGEIDHKVLASMPGQNVKIDQDLLTELRGFIYSIFAQFPDTNVSVERILSRQAALDHIQKSQDT